jgi:hypothetical protein
MQWAWQVGKLSVSMALRRGLEQCTPGHRDLEEVWGGGQVAAGGGAKTLRQVSVGC